MTLASTCIGKKPNKTDETNAANNANAIATNANATNAKTNETARHGYYTIDESSASGNTGVIEQFEPQPIATYSENQLIKAEASARSG